MAGVVAGVALLAAAVVVLLRAVLEVMAGGRGRGDGMVLPKFSQAPSTAAACRYSSATHLRQPQRRTGTTASGARSSVRLMVAELFDDLFGRKVGVLCSSAPAPRLALAPVRTPCPPRCSPADTTHHSHSRWI